MFRLFGRFTTIINGSEVAFPEAAFFTYLKLTLLSGEAFFDYCEASSTGVPAKLIRDVLDKGNLEPRPGQGGRYDFVSLTGLSLRYREGFGIELQGSNWKCDLHEFEEIWAQRETLPEESLRTALALYGRGIDIRTWKRDPQLVECSEWVKKRLSSVAEHRTAIEEELQRRLAAMAPADIEGDPSRGRGQIEGLNDDAVRHETSGSAEAASSFDIPAETSTSWRYELREDHQEDSARVGADSGSEQAKLQARRAQQEPTAEGDTVSIQRDKTDAEGAPNPEPSEPEQRRVFLPLNEPKRTVSGRGVMIVALVALVLTGLGFAVGRLSNGQVQANQSSAKPNESRVKNERSRSSDFVAPEPENPVALDTLYLSDAANSGIVSESEEVVIGHQIFTGYIRSNSIGYNETSPVFNLNREFQTVKCIIGVPDRNRLDLYAPAKEVIFRGDGKVLKKVRVSASKPVSVEVPVGSVKALVITFIRPVVIVSAEVWR